MKERTMKSIVIAVAAGVSMAVAGLAMAADDAEGLLKANGCSGCHDMSAKKVGPSMKDIAAKAPKGADSAKWVTDTAAKITSGKGHPAVKAKPEDVAKTLQAVVAK